MFEPVDLAGRLVVAGAFTWAVAAKLADLPGLHATLYLSRLTRPWARQLAVLLPMVEFGSAVSLTAIRPAWFAALGSAVLLAVFMAYLAADQHADDSCNCFGRRGRASRRSGIVRDLLLIAALVPALVRGPAAPRWGVPAQLDVVFVLAVFVLAGTLLAGTLLAGTLLAGAWIGAPLVRDRATRRPSGRPSGRRRLGAPTVAAPVVRVEAPVFDLPALDGTWLRPVAGTGLLFVEPGCDLCAAVLPGVADRADVTVLVVGDRSGAVALAERFRLTAGRVGLDTDGAVADAYAVPGTPAACRVSAEGILVDADGRSVTRLAVGVDAVRALLLPSTRLPPPGSPQPGSPQPVVITPSGDYVRVGPAAVPGEPHRTPRH